MIKPGTQKSPRDTSGPTARTTNSITTTTATPSIASIKQHPRGRHESKRELGFNASSPNQHKPEKWSEVSTRSPSPSPITPDSAPKIGNQLSKFGPTYRVRSADRNKAIRKRAKLKQIETKPTCSRPEESKVKPKRNASDMLRIAAATVASAAGAAVSKVGKAFDKAGESLFANKERALLPASMAGLSNAEILKILKHVEHPKADSAKFLRDVAVNYLPPQSGTYSLLYLRAFVKGRKFNSEQALCQDLMKDLRERTNLSAASDQLSELFKCKPSFDELIAEVVAWDESPLKDKVQVLLQGVKAGFDSRQPQDS